MLVEVPLQLTRLTNCLLVVVGFALTWMGFANMAPECRTHLEPDWAKFTLVWQIFDILLRILQRYRFVPFWLVDSVFFWARVNLFAWLEVVISFFIYFAVSELLVLKLLGYNLVYGLRRLFCFNCWLFWGEFELFANTVWTFIYWNLVSSWRNFTIDLRLLSTSSESLGNFRAWNKVLFSMINFNLNFSVIHFSLSFDFIILNFSLFNLLVSLNIFVDLFTLSFMWVDAFWRVQSSTVLTSYCWFLRSSIYNRPFCES